MAICNHKVGVGAIILMLLITVSHIRYSGCRLGDPTISGSANWITGCYGLSQMETLKQGDPLITGSGKDNSEMEPSEMDPADSSESCAKTYYYYEEDMTCDAPSCKEKCKDHCLIAALVCCCAYDPSEGCKFRVPAPGGCTNDADDVTCFQLCGSYCKDSYTCCCGRWFNLDADGTWRQRARL